MFPIDTKILVVDDMGTMRKIVAKTLKNFGYTDITDADDGSTAWPKIELASESGKPFQLIISDWNMPLLSGLELLKKVRGTNKIQKTPFILLTAEAESTNIVEAVSAGVNDYIIKPFQPITLKEKLDRVWSKIKKSVAN